MGAKANTSRNKKLGSIETDEIQSQMHQTLRLDDQQKLLGS